MNNAALSPIWMALAGEGQRVAGATVREWGGTVRADAVRVG